MFSDLANPYGAAAFEMVAYPMPELLNKKTMRKTKRSVKKMLRAPKPPSQIVKNFLLTYNG